MKRIIQCRYCGVEVQITNAKVVTCASDECRHKMAHDIRMRYLAKKRLPLTEQHCQVCGDLYLPIRRNQLTCASLVCRATAKARLNAKLEAKTHPAKYRECKVCGKRFRLTYSRAATCGAKACRSRRKTEVCRDLQRSVRKKREQKLLNTITSQKRDES